VLPPQLAPRHAQNDASSVYVQVVLPLRPIGGPPSADDPLEEPPDEPLVDPLPDEPPPDDVLPEEDPLVVDPLVEPPEDPLAIPPLELPPPDDVPPEEDPPVDPVPEEVPSPVLPASPQPFAPATTASVPRAARNTCRSRRRRLISGVLLFTVAPLTATNVPRRWTGQVPHRSGTICPSDVDSYAATGSPRRIVAGRPSLDAFLCIDRVFRSWSMWLRTLRAQSGRARSAMRGVGRISHVALVAMK
jgi:hypothetical protein